MTSSSEYWPNPKESIVDDETARDVFNDAFRPNQSVAWSELTGSASAIARAAILRSRELRTLKGNDVAENFLLGVGLTLVAINRQQQINDFSRDYPAA